MNCKLCKHKKLVSVICTLDESRMCEGCGKEHAQRTGHFQYLVKYIDWFKKQNESETKKSQITSLLKKKIQSAIDDLPRVKEELSVALANRKNELKEYVSKTCDETISRASLSHEFAKYQFEKSFHALYSKNPSISGLAHLISNLTLQSEVDELVFSEVLKPEVINEIPVMIRNSLNYTFKVYPNSKPLSLVYFKPNTSKIYWFNTLSEKIEVQESAKSNFNMYLAWCILPDSSIFATGGCSYDSISANTFKIQPFSNVFEIFPSMNSERYMHGIAYLEGFVYVFGGVTSQGNTNSCEKLQLGGKNWENFGEMNSKKAKMTVCVIGKKIYVGDENEIEVFNTEDNSFKVISVFKNIQYMIMVSTGLSFMIFRKDCLYEVTPEPDFITKQIAKVPMIEYFTISEPVLICHKIYFVLDFDRSVYCYDLNSLSLKQVCSLN